MAGRPFRSGGARLERRLAGKRRDAADSSAGRGQGTDPPPRRDSNAAAFVSALRGAGNRPSLARVAWCRCLSPTPSRRQSRWCGCSARRRGSTWSSRRATVAWRKARTAVTPTATTWACRRPAGHRRGDRRRQPYCAAGGRSSSMAHLVVETGKEGYGPSASWWSPGRRHAEGRVLPALLSTTRSAGDRRSPAQIDIQESRSPGPSSVARYTASISHSRWRQGTC